VNPDRLREELHRIGATLPAGETAERAPVALARGRRTVARRRNVRSVAAVAVAIAAFTSYGIPGSGTAPASAAVSCFADRVVVTGRDVAMGADGVRLTVTNTTEHPIWFLLGDAGVIVQPGRSSVDLAARPGDVTVSCETGAGTAPASSIRVVDHAGSFVDDALSCEAQDVRTFRGDGGLHAGDPVALTAEMLDASLTGATVEPAGYRGARSRRFVRVRRGARTLAVAVWHEMPEPGTWTLDEIRRCVAT
jgi:hypothetical protein